MIFLSLSWASFSIWGWARGSPLHTLASSILLPENDSFNFSFFLGFRSQAPGVQSEAASGISLPHFGRAGRRGGGPTAQWQIMQILPEHLINHSVGRGTQLISELASVASSRCEASPRLEWHQSSSESLKVWGLISWRNWPLLPITTLQSRLDTCVDMREREADYSKQEAQRQPHRRQ